MMLVRLGNIRYEICPELYVLLSGFMIEDEDVDPPDFPLSLFPFPLYKFVVSIS